MKKKLILATAGVLSIMTLGACSSGTNQEIATMKGSKITVEDFYNEAKKDQTNQGIVRNMIIYDVFENAYGDKVTDKMVDAEYKKQEKAMGDNFESQLQAAGYTKESFKDYLKQSLSFQEGLKSHVKLTDSDKKAAWDSFHPEVTARVISAASEEDANNIKKQIDDGGDFAKIAKEKSTDSATKENGGKIKFDSQSTDVPTEVKDAAFKLKDGQVSDVVTSMDPSTYQSSYYIVKMEKNQAKGNDMKKYSKEIKQIATDNKMADQAFTTSVIAQELKKANVKIKDDAFEGVLSGFTETQSTGSSKAKTSETKTSESKKASETKASETAETKTSETASSAKEQASTAVSE